MERKVIVVAGSEVKDRKVDLQELPEIAGKINTDVSSARLYANETCGLTISTSEIGPNGFLAAHRASGTVCIQVLKGSGVSGIVNENEDICCEISLNAGDLIVFEEGMLPHCYKAGDEGLVYVAFSCIGR